METEYFDTVNKEIEEIELFFRELYSTSKLPKTYTLRVLPLLVLEDTSSVRSKPPDQFSHSIASLIGRESDDGTQERFVADLRTRYKQLKVLQDQLHIELTRLRIWRITHPRCSAEVTGEPLTVTTDEWKEAASKSVKATSEPPSETATHAHVTSASAAAPAKKAKQRNVMETLLAGLFWMSILGGAVYYYMMLRKIPAIPQHGPVHPWPRH